MPDIPFEGKGLEWQQSRFEDLYRNGGTGKPAIPSNNYAAPNAPLNPQAQQLENLYKMPTTAQQARDLAQQLNNYNSQPGQRIHSPLPSPPKNTPIPTGNTGNGGFKLPNMSRNPFPRVPNLGAGSIGAGAGAAAITALSGGSPGQVIGAGLGGAAGTYLGGALGATFGGVPGAIIGANLGGALGSFAGGALGDWLNGLLDPNKGVPDHLKPKSAGSEPPRNLGVPGVAYQLTFYGDNGTYIRYATAPFSVAGDVIPNFYPDDPKGFYRLGLNNAYVTYKRGSYPPVTMFPIGQPELAEPRYPDNEPPPFQFPPPFILRPQNPTAPPTFPNLAPLKPFTPEGTPSPSPSPTPGKPVSPDGSPNPSPSPGPSPKTPDGKPSPFPPNAPKPSGGGGGGSTGTGDLPVNAPTKAKGETTESPSLIPFPFIPPIPAKAPTPSTGGNGAFDPPSPPIDSNNPCKGNACGQATLSKVNGLNDLMKGVDWGLLAEINRKVDIINTKMGDQITGGLSGKLNRLSKWLQIDRILNWLTFVTVLHNAYMLSSAISQTLFGALDNALRLVGLSDDDDPIETGKVVSSTIDGFAKSLLGVETVDGIKQAWAKFNRIYQAATNILYSIQSIGYSILESLEVVGNWVAQIGNAVKKFGVVHQNAYAWMNPNVNFTENPVIKNLNRLQEVVEGIEQITSELLNVQETSAELAKQSEELFKQVRGESTTGQPVTPKTPKPEHKPTATNEIAAGAQSLGSVISDLDLRPPES